MLHMSDQSSNNSWGSAAQFFLAKIGYASSGINSYDKEPSNKTTQNQPKTSQKSIQTSGSHANFAVYLCSNGPILMEQMRESHTKLVRAGKSVYGHFMMSHFTILSYWVPL